MTNVLNQLVNIKAHAEMEHGSSNEDKKVLHAAQRLDEPINIICQISVLIPIEQRAVDDLRVFHESIQSITKAGRLISREMERIFAGSVEFTVAQLAESNCLAMGVRTEWTRLGNRRE